MVRDLGWHSHCSREGFPRQGQKEEAVDRKLERIYRKYVNV